MCNPTLPKRMQDSFDTKQVPVCIQRPALGAIKEDMTPPIVEATLDDRVFAAQAQDQKQSALDKRLVALREQYTEVPAKGALGAATIVEAHSRQGGAQ